MLARTSILSRTVDPDVANAVVNAPEVRPFVGPGDDPLDIAPVLLEPKNIALMGEHGGFVFCWSAPGVYEVHTFILKGGRGQWARDAASFAIDAMRNHGADQLWTRIDPAHSNVIAFATEMGMKPCPDTVETFGKQYCTYSMGLY